MAHFTHARKNYLPKNGHFPQNYTLTQKKTKRVPACAETLFSLVITVSETYCFMKRVMSLCPSA